MAVSGTMAVSLSTFKGGSAGIQAQRGTNTWGDSYLLHPSGAQNDYLVQADAASEVFTTGITPTASGTMVLGSANFPLNASGLYMHSADSDAVLQVIATSSGLITVAA